MCLDIDIRLESKYTAVFIARKDVCLRSCAFTNRTTPFLFDTKRLADFHTGRSLLLNSEVIISEIASRPNVVRPPGTYIILFKGKVVEKTNAWYFVLLSNFISSFNLNDEATVGFQCLFPVF